MFERKTLTKTLLLKTSKVNFKEYNFSPKMNYLKMTYSSKYEPQYYTTHKS